MSAALGFVILNHDEPERLHRLVRRLTSMFDSPPIACHHDFGQCPMEVASGWPENVRFVRPHRATSWGTFSVVEAALDALRLLYETRTVRWFALLSGADYPIARAARILEELDAAESDAFIEQIRVDPASDDRCKHPQSEFIRRYFAVAGPGPFGGALACYAGELWFTGSERAAQRLLRQDAIFESLARHCRAVPSPDETFFQSLLASDPALRISPWPRRYIDWRDAWATGAAHPKTLTCEDLPAMKASGAHFARKFHPSVDARVLDHLDRLIDG